MRNRRPLPKRAPRPPRPRGTSSPVQEVVGPRPQQDPQRDDEQPTNYERQDLQNGQQYFLGRGRTWGRGRVRGRGRGQGQARVKVKDAEPQPFLNTGIKDIKIINLSSKKLSTTEKTLLNKGLKFTPTPPIGNPEQLNEDLKEFNRKLRLAEYFDCTEDTDISLVRNKSDFIPPLTEIQR